MPRSPRYSWPRPPTLTPASHEGAAEHWQACMSSWPRCRAEPYRYASRTRRCSYPQDAEPHGFRVRSASSCHAREKRRRVPKSAMAHLESRRIAQQRDLRAQARPALVQVVGRMIRFEVQLVDDGEQGHFEHDRMEPGTRDHDVDLAGVDCRGRYFDVLGVELEQPEEVDEIAVDEAKLRR